MSSKKAPKPPKPIPSVAPIQTVSAQQTGMAEMAKRKKKYNLDSTLLRGTGLGGDQEITLG